MATLEFNKQGGSYIASITVNNDYALHLERAKPGTLSVKQRSTSEGNYGQCAIPEEVQSSYWTTLDWVFSHGYYPMNLQFISSVPITKAELNEVAE